MTRCFALLALTTISVATLTRCAPAQPEPGVMDCEAAPPEVGLRADQLAFDSDRTGNYELFVMNRDGTEPRQLTSNAEWDSFWPRISPDRRTLLFHRAPKGVHDTNYAEQSLWIVHADGTGLCRLRDAGEDGWGFSGHAEWSPDGTQLTLFGGARSNPQVFITDARGRQPRQVTSRGGTNIDPAWSPDGKTIVFVGCPESFCTENDYEIYTVPATGGTATRLTNNALRDHDPYFSRDGSQIAWLQRTRATANLGVGSWGILLMNADGTAQRTVIDDGEINSKPHWGADGALYFHRMEFSREKRFRLFRIQPDGSNLTELLPNDLSNSEFPAD